MGRFGSNCVLNVCAEMPYVSFMDVFGYLFEHVFVLNDQVYLCFCFYRKYLCLLVRFMCERGVVIGKIWK